MERTSGSEVWIPWYPTDPVRQRWLYVFYIISLMINLGYFVVYVSVQHPHGPTIYGQDHPAKFGWHFVFFAQWLGILHCLFWGTALIDLYIRSASVWSQRIHAFKDKFYDVLFALTLLTVITYWFTVFPNRGGNYKQLYEDVFAYGLPAVCIILEMFVIPHRYATRACHVVRDMFIPLGIYACYVGFSYWCHYRNGAWAYKFQATLEDSLIAISYAAGGIGVILLFSVGKMISRCMWQDMPLSAEHDDDLQIYNQLTHSYLPPIPTNLPPNAQTTQITISSDYAGELSGNFSGRFSYVDDEIQNQHIKQREHIVRDHQAGMSRFV